MSEYLKEEMPLLQTERKQKMGEVVKALIDRGLVDRNDAVKAWAEWIDKLKKEKNGYQKEGTTDPLAMNGGGTCESFINELFGRANARKERSK